MDQRHLDHLFDYLFRQEEHHGIDLDPLFVASNLLDLLGLRVTGEYTRDHVGTFLPRVTRPRLLAFLGLPDLDRTPIVVADLAEAAAAAFALVELVGKAAVTVRARRAAVAAATSLVGTAEIAEQLDISPRALPAATGRTRVRGDAASDLDLGGGGLDGLRRRLVAGGAPGCSADRDRRDHGIERGRGVTGARADRAQNW